MVLAADERRAKLTAKLHTLQARIDAGDEDDALIHDLEKVHVDLQAIGAASAEGRARKILAVCLLSSI